MVLPVPLGPMVQNTLPTSKLTLSTAATLRYTFRRDATCAVRASEGYIVCYTKDFGVQCLVSLGRVKRVVSMLTPRHT